AVDNEFFERGASAARPHRAALRASWGIPAEAPVFLFAGKFQHKKRPLDFVRAVARAHDTCPDVWGLMVGDGDLRSEIESEIARLGAPIRLAGSLNQTQMPGA